jgi:hypothetical protein
VRKKRHFENAFESACVVFNCCRSVAVVTRNLARLFCKCRILLDDLDAAQIRERTFVPFHIEGLRTF